MANEDKATRYHRLRRRASLLGSAAATLLLIVLLVTGAAAWLRTAIDTLTGGSMALTVALFTAIVVVLTDAVQIPFAYFQGLTLERRYGLGRQTRAGWWLDRGRALAVTLTLGVPAAIVVFALIAAFPAVWWLPAAVLFVFVLVGLALAAPIVLLPLFYTFAPLNRPELAARLLALARRAGTDVVGVFEWRLGDRTRKANAALTGLGHTRRILLSDTLLADHSDDEIEVILAHELSHHVHRDIWTGLALEAVSITVGLLVADAALAAVSGHFGIAGKWDVAALPVLVLALGAVSLVLAPLAHAVSRAHERRADRYALEMTKNAQAFISAMKRLSASNLAEERPTRLVEWLFHSHPPTSARIAAATGWQQRQHIMAGQGSASPPDVG